MMITDTPYLATYVCRGGVARRLIPVLLPEVPVPSHHFVKIKYYIFFFKYVVPWTLFCTWSSYFSVLLLFLWCGRHLVKGEASKWMFHLIHAIFYVRLIPWNFLNTSQSEEKMQILLKTLTAAHSMMHNDHDHHLYLYLKRKRSSIQIIILLC